MAAENQESLEFVTQEGVAEDSVVNQSKWILGINAGVTFGNPEIYYFHHL